MEFLNEIMQYVVIPIGAFVWLIYTRQQEHHTDIEVMKSRVDSHKISHDRELVEIKDTTNKIFHKLDSIEETLRK